MLGLAIPICLVFCIGAPVLFSYLVWMARKKFTSEKESDIRFIMYTKFLFVKLQPRTFWWSPVVCLKCLAYTFATVFFDEGFSQVMWIFLSVIVYFFFMCFQKPWRFDECNLFDVVVHLCVLGFVFVCQGLLFKAPNSDDVLTLIDISMYLPFVIAFFAVLSLAMQHFRPMSAAERQRMATEILTALTTIGEHKEKWQEIYMNLTRQEQNYYVKTLEILMTEFGDSTDNTKAKRLKSSSGEYTGKGKGEKVEAAADDDNALPEDGEMNDIRPTANFNKAVNW